MVWGSQILDLVVVVAPLSPPCNGKVWRFSGVQLMHDFPEISLWSVLCFSKHLFSINLCTITIPLHETNCFFTITIPLQEKRYLRQNVSIWASQKKTSHVFVFLWWKLPHHETSFPLSSNYEDLTDKIISSMFIDLASQNKVGCWSI